MTSGSSKAHLGAGLPCLDPWEQAFAGAAAAVISCPVQRPPLPGWGMLVPAAGPKTWRCASQTDAGPGDVVSGAVNQETRAYCLSLSHPRARNCAGGALLAAPGLLHRSSYRLNSRTFPAAMSMVGSVAHFPRRRGGSSLQQCQRGALKSPFSEPV